MSDLEKMRKWVTPKNYTIVMLIVFALSLILQIYHKSYFGFFASGFLLGIWLGNWLRWVFIK